METLQINPELARQCLQAAHLYMETKAYKKALKHFDDVIHCHQPHNVEAYLEAARIYARFGKPESILKVINRLHNFSAKTPESLVLLARAQFLMKQYAECDVTLKEIFTKARDFSEALALEAELFIYTEKCENAIEMLQSLNLRFPKNREYLILLATAYYSSKKYHRTIHICSTLIQAGFNDPKVKGLFEIAKKKEKTEALVKLRETKPFKWCLALTFPWLLEGELRMNSADKTMQENLVRETLVDDRTGLYNDRAARNQIPALASRRKKQFFLTMADIDFFKSFNDVHYNHQVGNAVLKALAKAGQKIFTKDHIWRYGGEEIIWVHDGSEQEAVEKAEEFRKYVEEHVAGDANEIIKKEDIKHYADGWDHKKDELFVVHYPVTLSQATVLWGEDGNSLESLLTAADDGLYNAKEAGRNAIVYRSILRNKGEKPIKYTPELLEVLHEYAIKKGAQNWWGYLPNLSQTVREEVLEYARNTLTNKEVMQSHK